MQWVFKPLSVLVGFAFLSLVVAAYLEFHAAAETNSRERPRNIERNAHRVADAIESLGIVLPKGELVDLTDQLRAVGTKPAMAAPDCPELCFGPTKIYAASLPGDCEGIAIAGIDESARPSPPEKNVNLSLVGNGGGFVFRSVKLSNAGVISLIGALVADGSFDC